VYFPLTIVVACSVLLVAANKRSLIDMRPKVDESRTVHECDCYCTACQPRERVLVAFETFWSIHTNDLATKKQTETMRVGENEDEEDWEVKHRGAVGRVLFLPLSRP